MSIRKGNEVFIVKKADYDGYRQAFNEIGTSKRKVHKWLTDGSLEEGDVVMVARPVFKVVRARSGRFQYGMKPA